MNALDERMMRLCLRLARRGRVWAHPNPMVGAVVASGGRVIATGWHRRAGAAHAEVEALRRAGRRARGATLYVSLEPCVHHGRTPPCVNAVIASGVRRVVVGAIDPNPAVHGRGVRRLRAAGVRVDVGVLGGESRRLNETFFFAMTRRRPFVTLKAAATLDGRMATRTGDAKWITGAAARREAHRLRAEHDAVLVGAGTVIADDPRLTVRGVPGPQPVRVVLDGRLRAPPNARVFLGRPPVWLATTIAAKRRRGARYRAGVVLGLGGRGGRIAIPSLLRHLWLLGVNSVLVEGGGETHAAFVEARCVDRVVAFVAPAIVGGRDAVPMIGGRGVARLREAPRLGAFAVRRVGSDLVIDARVRR